ncbi:TIGR01440 family protein [Pseudalkalibacillus caeni]|uniref:UPF0340 protein FCL54_14515 n=1 Tax=Exobacillus caeni TaxID=2574798 RepID=A0A5R9F7C0_9BACL|nr:TIGR01440 family protein [Pseudalkalibacillus caeni]TLS36723.1 TIGR01440 family protein [Pseudalkalibacillus caeni]
MEGLDLKEVSKQVRQALTDLQTYASLSSRHLLVIGCSSSEVMGKHIGTAGTEDIAGAVYEAVKDFQEETGVELAFQCCEHLNRALAVERETAYNRGYEIVAAVPTRKAGGSMAAYAFSQFKDPVLVEFLKADAGIDIGDTFIGMHLRHVAVPVRSSVKQVGQAHLTMARTRPKLIGGERASYPSKNDNCF